MRQVQRYAAQLGLVLGQRAASPGSVLRTEH